MILFQEKNIFLQNLDEVYNFGTSSEINDYINTNFKIYLKTGKINKETKFHSRKRLYKFYFENIVRNSRVETKFQRFSRHLDEVASSFTYNTDRYFRKNTQNIVLGYIDELRGIEQSQIYRIGRELNIDNNYLTNNKKNYF